MSIDIFLRSADGAVIDADVPGNITFNVLRAFTDALGFPIFKLNGSCASDFTLAIERAVIRMQQNRAKYEAMMPANGWGTYDITLEYLISLRDAVKQNPSAVIDCS